jgi:hypothetical protein
LIGIANPMPTFPPLGAKIAVLIPIVARERAAAAAVAFLMAAR